MNATDELREMLDECGIEYEQSRIEGVAEYAHVTKWETQTGNRCTFYEIEDGYPPYFTRMFIDTPTAAQTIAATMPDEASTHKALIRESDARMALQRDYNNQIVRIRNQRKQLREMQAALERETCELPAAPDYCAIERYGIVERCGVTEWRKCSACGSRVLANPARYCPSCGREVVG